VQGTVVHPPGMGEERPRTLSGKIESGRLTRCSARERGRGGAWSIRAKSLVLGSFVVTFLESKKNATERRIPEKLFLFFKGLHGYETLDGAYHGRLAW
jgi:hypothetical protein